MSFDFKCILVQCSILNITSKYMKIVMNTNRHLQNEEQLIK